MIGLLVCTLAFGVAWMWMAYIERTDAIPAPGGIYSEALVGEPQFINPILLGINDVDRDIAALVYSGLMKYDAQGNIIRSCRALRGVPRRQRIHVLSP